MQRQYLAQNVYQHYYTYYYASEYLKSSQNLKGVVNVLNGHMRNLQQRLLHTPPTESQLKQIQKQYNANIVEQNQAFQSLLEVAKKGAATDAKKAQDALVAILQKTVKGLNAEQYAHLAQSIEWDPIKNVPYVKADSTNLAYSLVKYQLGSRASYRIASKIIPRIDTFIEQLLKDFADTDMAKIRPYLTELQQIREDIKRRANVQQSRESYEGKITYHGERLKINDEDFGNQVYDRLYQISAELYGLKYLNKTLSWKYTELVGALVAQDSYTIAVDALVDEIEAWANTKTIGETGTQAQVSKIDGSQLHQATLAQAKKWSSMNGDIYELKPYATGRAGKMDTSYTLELTTSNGNKKTATFGVSMKNYAESSEFITAQGYGSFLQYLEGAESIARGFTKHMLNIYANHPSHEVNNNTNYGVIMAEARRLALPNLKAQIVYSALSGKHAMKIGQGAEILALYNKPKKAHESPTIVKLYSIPKIALDIISSHSYDAVDIKVNGHTFNNEPILANTWEDAQNELGISTFPSAEAASIRMTKALLEARSTIIAVNLSKSILT